MEAESDKDHLWAMWIDPREVERRRMQRSKMKIAERVGSIEEDLKVVHEASADAKSKRDREKQRQASELFRELNLELKQLRQENDLPEENAEPQNEQPVPADPETSDSDNDEMLFGCVPFDQNETKGDPFQHKNSEY